MSNIIVADRHTQLAIDVVAFGQEQGLTFKPLLYRGVPEEPFIDDNYLYRLARQMPEDFTMPMEAWRRFFAVYESHIPVRDVVIAEELEPYKEWISAAKAARAAATGLVSVAFGLLAAAPALLAADPKLILILEDGSWISIAEWL